MIEHPFSEIGPKLALKKWEENCIGWFEEHLPNIPFKFDTEQAWNINKKLSSRIGFKATINDLKDKDETFIRALRCAIVEVWREPRSRLVRGAKPYPFELARAMQNCLREFKSLHVKSIFELNEQAFDLVKVKIVSYQVASKVPLLDALEKFAIFLRVTKVLPHLNWVPDIEARRQLSSKRAVAGKRAGESNFNSDSGETDGDRRVGALMELAHLALSKPEDLSDNDSKRLAKLTQMDHICIYSMMILLCAPARVNEVLSMTIGDIKTFQSFAEWERPPVGHQSASRDKVDGLYRAHQSLFYRDINNVDLDEKSRTVLLQKGSKGGKWAPKPVLVWMQAILQECIARIKENGCRSRKLAMHYRSAPDVLYLPKWAEYLREKDWWTHNEILGVWGDLPEKPSELINASEVFPGFHPGSLNLYFKTGRVEKRLWADCPKKGVKPYVFNGKQATELMLRSVTQSLLKAQLVTPKTVVSSDVSERLFLTDCLSVMPFTVGAIDYQSLTQRFGRNGKFSIFKKLGIKIYQKNQLIDAFVGTHDARHFICDHATKADLSDVLINKWCRRADVRQMNFYEQYDPIGRANRAAQKSNTFSDQDPVAAEVSANLQRREELKIRGDSSTWIKMGDRKIQTSSVDKIINAGDSPILARTSSGEPLMLTPVLTGVCSHQHHITPCQNYDVYCLGCADHTLVKGHLPTNEAALKIRTVQRRMLIDYVEAVIPSINVGTIEHVESLISQLERIFKLQINQQQLSSEKFADLLIERVDEDILRRIKSTALRDLLRKAFVSDRVGSFVDDPNIEAGSTITYNDRVHTGRMGLNLLHLETGTHIEINETKKRVEAEFGKGCIDAISDTRLMRDYYEPDRDEVE